MSTRAIPSSLGFFAIDAAYDYTNTLLCVQHPDNLAVLRREDPARTFEPLTILPLDKSGGDVTSLAWARPDHGPLLASGSRDGTLLLWAPAPGPLSSSWTNIARLRCGHASILQLAFDPSAHSSRFFERDLRDPKLLTWQPCNDLRCSGAQGPPTALSWREPDDDAAAGVELPPLLAVGTHGGSASVWQLRRELRAWVRAAELPLESSGSGVACLAWCPALGRPAETLAVGRGPEVTLFTLRGPTDALEVARCATLRHASPVWQAEWNLVGTWLATSTQDGQVALWRPDFAGEWQLCNTIRGGDDAAMAH